MAPRHQLMKKFPPTGRSFFWHGVLILLPVLVLSSAGFFSLRQDRILARHEAVEKAQALAEQMADSVWQRLFRSDAPLNFPEHSFRLDAEGRLAFPAMPPTSPEPLHLEPEALTEAQRRLWTLLTSVPVLDRPQGIALAQEFLALVPPPSFAAVAQFRLAQQLEESGRYQEAATQFELLAKTYPEAVGETGLALSPLARLKALQLLAQRSQKDAGPNGSQLGPRPEPVEGALELQSLCSNLVVRPSFLSEHLLSRAAALQSVLRLTNVVEPWMEKWAQDERLRELARAVLNTARHVNAGSRTTSGPIGSTAADAEPTDSVRFVMPALFWFHLPDLNPAGQPIYPPSKGIMPKKVEKNRNALGSVVLSGPVATIPENAGPAPTPSRLSSLERFWLATKLPSSEGGHWVVCRALGIWYGKQQILLGSPPLDDLKQGLPILPAWLDYELHVAGVSISSSNEMQRVSFPSDKEKKHPRVKSHPKSVKEAAAEPELLASAVRLENGIEFLRVELAFASPQLFYARQRTRTYVFGGLIGLAAAAALVGFISAQRAFLRQQQLSELKSNFVSSVSHELRAPIASMRLMAESLERGKVSGPGRQAEYYAFLVQECRRLSALIENVLNFARIEQGRKQYELEPTDVVGLLQQVARILEPAGTAKQVRLVLELPADAVAKLTPPPFLDGPAIQQALINLLDNALKHSPADGLVTLGLRVEEWRAGKRIPTEDGLVPGSVARAEEAVLESMLILYVRDQGPGIPEEEHERIFERFYRRGSELRRETQGIGIGLSIVKHVAEAHLGRVRVESQPGQGSTFLLELPLPPRGGHPSNP
jgi:signal transduction histidine kinase